MIGWGSFSRDCSDGFQEKYFRFSSMYETFKNVQISISNQQGNSISSYKTETPAAPPRRRRARAPRRGQGATAAGG